MVVMTTREYASKYAGAILGMLYKGHSPAEYTAELENLQSVIDSHPFILHTRTREFGFDQEPEDDAKEDLGGDDEGADVPIEIISITAEALVRRLIKWMELKLKNQQEEG